MDQIFEKSRENSTQETFQYVSNQINIVSWVQLQQTNPHKSKVVEIFEQESPVSECKFPFWLCTPFNSSSKWIPIEFLAVGWFSSRRQLLLHVSSLRVLFFHFLFSL